MAEGRQVGYPTANITLTLTCEPGTYAGLVQVASQEAVYRAAVYVDDRRKLLEAHLLDFTGDLYDQTIDVQLLEHLQGVLPFQDTLDMKRIVDEAVALVRRYFETQDHPTGDSSRV